MIDRSMIKKGMFLTSTPGPAAVVKGMYQRGQFMVGGACPGAVITKAAELPPPVPTLAEIAARIKAVKAKVDAFNAARRAGK
jgi:hypothetical protein